MTVGLFDARTISTNFSLSIGLSIAAEELVLRSDSDAGGDLESVLSVDVGSEQGDDGHLFSEDEDSKMFLVDHVDPNFSRFRLSDISYVPFDKQEIPDSLELVERTGVG